MAAIFIYRYRMYRQIAIQNIITQAEIIFFFFTLLHFEKVNIKIVFSPSESLEPPVG